MDRKFSKDPEIERLIQLSHAARCCLETQVTALKRRLDVPTRLRSSLKEHPTRWLVGSLASGLAASLIFRRKPPGVAKTSRTLPTALLGLTLTAVKPFAKVWLSNQVKSYLTAQRSPAATRSSHLDRADFNPHS